MIRDLMKLNVITDKTEQSQPWYAGGLSFTCTQCGNCCTGGPGYVWISKEEIEKLAEHLKITPAEAVEKYCRKIDGKFSLKERRSPAGLYDCIFLKETKVPSQGDEKVVHTIRACSVYPVRPLQCRTWPFWPENLGMRRHQLVKVSENIRMGCAIFRFYLRRENHNIARALARYNGSVGKRWYSDKVINQWTRWNGADDLGAAERHAEVKLTVR